MLVPSPIGDQRPAHYQCRLTSRLSPTSRDRSRTARQIRQNPPNPQNSENFRRDFFFETLETWVANQHPTQGRPVAFTIARKANTPVDPFQTRRRTNIVAANRFDRRQGRQQTNPPPYQPQDRPDTIVAIARSLGLNPAPASPPRHRHKKYETLSLGPIPEKSELNCETATRELGCHLHAAVRAPIPPHRPLSPSAPWTHPVPQKCAISAHSHLVGPPTAHHSHIHIHETKMQKKIATPAGVPAALALLCPKRELAHACASLVFVS